MRHTPGPWSNGNILKDHDHDEFYIVVGAHGRHMMDDYRCAAIVPCRSEDEEEGKANAQLIAASPRMFDVLEEVVSMCDEQEIAHSPWLQRAKKAVDQAKGEE